MELAADEGLFLIVCSVAPGSRDADALSLLASWSAADRTRQAEHNQQPYRSPEVVIPVDAMTAPP
jgi:hypothetical protein